MKVAHYLVGILGMCAAAALASADSTEGAPRIVNEIPGADPLVPFESYLLKPSYEAPKISPDGKHMYVADWNFGGWVNRKVRGRLYRVTYTGGDVPAEPARAGAGRRRSSSSSTGTCRS